MPEQHERDLTQLFSAFKRFGLVLNSAKCEFGVREIEFLGHHVSEKGIKLVPGKVEAKQRFERLRTVKSLQRFLGLVNFYRRFLPNVAGMMRPLTDALAGAPRQLFVDRGDDVSIQNKSAVSQSNASFPPGSRGRDLRTRRRQHQSDSRRGSPGN